MKILGIQCLLASESIGYYSKGSLKEGYSIDDFAQDHLLKLFRPRGQLYLHKDLGLAIEGLADYMREDNANTERLQIGDLSAKNGGKISRHESHQNGLDADLVYYRVNSIEQEVTKPEWDEYFVVNGKLSSNFSLKRNWQAFKYLIKNHPVQRIFVDQAVKKEMCKLAKSLGEQSSEREVLRALREENTVHKTHFHIRLRCPADSPKCVDQADPPTGDGCS